MFSSSQVYISHNGIGCNVTNQMLTPLQEERMKLNTLIGFIQKREDMALLDK